MKLRYSLGDQALDATTLQLWSELEECEVAIADLRPPYPRDFHHLDQFAEAMERFLLDNWAETIDLGAATRRALDANSGGYFCDPHIGHPFLGWHGTKEPGVVDPHLEQIL